MDRRRNWFSKLLVVAGTILTALPILAPVVFAVLLLLNGGPLRFDYLMPAELAPLAIAGGLMLLGAAFRLGTHRWFIAGSLGLAVIMLVASQALAVATGLASGEVEPEGLPLAGVMVGLVIYTMAVIALVVWGWRLIRQAFAKDINSNR